MKPKFGVYTKVAVGAILILIGIGWVFWNILGYSMCGNEIISTAVAQNRIFKAVVFKRDCGATTGCSVQVSLKLAIKPLFDYETGNIFIIDGDGPVEARWKDSRTLKIIYPIGSNLFKSRKQILFFKVEYIPNVMLTNSK